MPVSETAVLPERLPRVKCRLYLADSEEKGWKNPRPITLRNGNVDLRHPQSMWYTAGRAVEGLMCE